MALREEFENTGNWLFRWRSYLPLIVIAIFLLALREYEYPGHSEKLDHIWEVVCLLVSFLGLGIRIVTIGHTPRGTSGRNTKKQVAETLNTTGLYSVVRNPLYLGNFFMWLGIALFAHLWWLTLIYILVFWLYYERIIFAEEAYLRDKFGNEYLEWANKTPAFIPKLSQYRKANLPFSLRNVLRREYNGFFAVIVILFVLETVGEIFVKGRLEFDLGWIFLLGIGFVVWMVLRSLKKYTKVLYVEGR
ncbi:methyltransferase family protein [Fidelibacter multiformis]|jgi:protein-S-isoprenylcysteine O-methyltransferase Ste14|uniref:methyltransferase family protein n=1 Tax=Fidelibacter multiformis TaxID=3377529 RepID=UPI0037DC8743